MQLSEIFHSIQGEGPAVGRPAIFVRLSNCNLNCIGCDTPIRNKVEETEPISVINRIKNYLKTYPNSRIVITGGEPLLQPDAINQIIDGIPGQMVDLETNGTIQDYKDLLTRFNIVVVSPKKNTFPTLIDSTKFFKDWMEISNSGRNNVFFKVVMGNLPWAWSESEIREVLNRSGMPTNRVWLMPAGENETKIRISGKNTWKVAMRLGCNYSDRLHIRCSGK
jgi:organic radical activating enzyme